MMGDRTRRTFLLSASALAGAVACPTLARAGEKQQLIVDKARIVVESFLNDPQFAKMRVYVQNAYGVLVIPDLLKGGFFIGVEHGTGVLLGRDPQSGAWSQPAFFEIWGGSFGLQFGGQSSDAIFTIMNQGAIQKLLSARFQLGADASVAVGELGAGVGAGTTVQFGEDVYAFARNMGVYGGLALDGTYAKPRNDLNQAYYGQPLTAEQIVRQRIAPAVPGTEGLRQALSQF
ncbi:lipid-binding SYLF domain-containing protein [Benzoatithermus flavus]|uniref:Lipid-binding SYLF domain-containing protein n=1 Tax=Benzoatithermus flavus TaxID=3108223 RepID=A0ABU8XR06_9PROT